MKIRTAEENIQKYSKFVRDEPLKNEFTINRKGHFQEYNAAPKKKKTKN